MQLTFPFCDDIDDVVTTYCSQKNISHSHEGTCINFIKRAAGSKNTSEILSMQIYVTISLAIESTGDLFKNILAHLHLYNTIVE